MIRSVGRRVKPTGGTGAQNAGRHGVKFEGESAVGAMAGSGAPFAAEGTASGEAERGSPAPLQIPHPELAHLYRYWLERCAGRPMPARMDVDPVDLPRRLLPHLFLVDVEEEPRRYRYRLVGSELTAAMGRELTGRYVDEMPYLFRKFALPAYAEVMAARAPIYREINAFEALQRIRYKRLLLPLSDDGARINMVMGAIFRG